MSTRRRGKDGAYYVRIRWRDVPRMYLSTGTGNKALARDMETTLRRLYREGRLDLLGLLKLRRFSLRQLHDAVTRGPLAVEQLRLGADSPELGPLVDEWLAWCKSPAGISPRTRRRYAAQTTRRYRVSWRGFYEVLPRGRAARLADLTAGFLADYRRTRVRAQGGAKRRPVADRPLAVATVNRDLVALGAFLTWCVEAKGLPVAPPKFNREREPSGRERWLSADELRALERACLDRWPEWWPLFATLAFTGMRYGEAAGLLGSDVQLAASRIVIHEGARRVKSSASVRDVPIPAPLAQVLGAHLARVTPGPADPVFPAPLSVYDRAYETFRRVCIAAGLHDAGRNPTTKPRPTVTIHDLRHTFGVHAAQAGVPIVRLQKLLGHATPHMTLRYMKHAPEAYFAEDASKIAASMTATTDAEAEARARQAREGLRSA